MVVHDLEQTAREIQTKLQAIHQADGLKTSNNPKYVFSKIILKTLFT